MKWKYGDNYEKWWGGSKNTCLGELFISCVRLKVNPVWLSNDGNLSRKLSHRLFLQCSLYNAGYTNWDYSKAIRCTCIASMYCNVSLKFTNNYTELFLCTAPYSVVKIEKNYIEKMKNTRKRWAYWNWSIEKNEKYKKQKKDDERIGIGVKDWARILSGFF